MNAFRDGMMGTCIRGGLLYFVVLIKKIFDFFIARTQELTLYYAACAKLRFFERTAGGFFFLWGTLYSGDKST